MMIGQVGRQVGRQVGGMRNNKGNKFFKITLNNAAQFQKGQAKRYEEKMDKQTY